MTNTEMYDKTLTNKVTNDQLRTATFCTACRTLQAFHKSVAATCSLALASNNLHNNIRQQSNSKTFILSFSMYAQNNINNIRQ